MIAEFWVSAVRLAVVLTLACVLVLILRVPVRRVSGARIAYATWLTVPAILVAAMLPAPRAIFVPALGALAPAFTPVTAASAAPSFDPRAWLAAAWLVGVVATALAFLRQQRRYVRALGPLQRLGQRIERAVGGEPGPALVGAWRARIVVPIDFARRYDASERRLILAHERVHLVRGDALANLAVAALRCLHWFNPIVHLAAARFRYDQELACDAAVIHRFPQARAAYAGAMLKTQLAVQARQALRLPVGCRWPSRHPFKERLLMLKRNAPSRACRALGFVLVIALGGGGGYAAWATQAPRSPDGVAEAAGAQVDARFTIALGGSAPSNVRLVARLGETFAASGDDPHPWHAEFVATARPKNSVALEATITQAGHVVARPSIVVAEGAPSSIEIGERGAPDYFRLDSTLFVRPAGWHVDPSAAADTVPRRSAGDISFRMPAQRLAPDGTTRDASEDVSFRDSQPPPYPPAAIAARQQGHLDLRVDIDAHGRPRDVAVARADPPEAEAAFGESAMATVRQWSFNPALDDGRAVAATILVPIDYRLADED